MSKFRMCRKFPMSLDQYKANMKVKYPEIKKWINDDIDIADRFYKAKFAYSYVKLNQRFPWEYGNMRSFEYLAKPEDAFEIWWDL